MNKEIILKNVIDKYKLSEPVPSEVRTAMAESRKKNLIIILKRETRYALFISATVSFFLWIKKFGISISIVKSAIAVSAAFIIGAGAITAAGVYTAVKTAEYLSNFRNNTANTQVTGTHSDQSVKQESVSYAVAVSPVEADDFTNVMLSEYRNKMISELRKIKGARAAISMNILDEYHTADKTLAISIIKLDEEVKNTGTDYAYRISAKIINTSNSRVFMHASVTAAGESTIPDSIQKLAEKIAVKL